MSAKVIKVKVPGSTMLMGEHAVLFGYPALACAVDKYLSISLMQRQDNQVTILSHLGHYQSDLLNIKEGDENLSFAVAVLKQFQTQLLAKNMAGFDILIESELSSTVGLGSSAAVSIGLVAALSCYLGESLSNQALFEKTLSVVHRTQGGRGSGTDIAASLYGGIIAYDVKNHVFGAFHNALDLGLFYAGYKTKTPIVLQQVEASAKTFPVVYQSMYQLMGDLTVLAINALKNNQIHQLGQLMNIYHGLMDGLGVSDKALSQIIYTLRDYPEVLGAKISGSGMGDCVLYLRSLGSKPVFLNDYQNIDINISQKGLQW